MMDDNLYSMKPTFPLPRGGRRGKRRTHLSRMPISTSGELGAGFRCCPRMTTTKSPKEIIFFVSVGVLLAIFVGALLDFPLHKWSSSNAGNSTVVSSVNLRGSNSKQGHNDPKFFYKHRKKQDCNWVSAEPSTRCYNEWKGKLILDFCPETCNLVGI